ncbi:hypothetical protein AB6A40_008519 [Gnathostoma spinigerum]|uniref:Uncharacterized protein n=1 Tax=Gnathostoma spinigerum TaxID=75299 RepID=A0ABD6EZP1_9BILA
MGYLQCARLGGGETMFSEVVKPFMDIIPSWSQFIQGTIYFVPRSRNEFMTIIADEDAQKDMVVDRRKLEAEEWANITYGNKTAYYYSQEVTGHYYHTVHSDGYYIVQITGIDDGGSSYGYTPALNGIVVEPVEPTEPSPTSTTTLLPVSSTPSPPSSAAPIKSTTIATTGGTDPVSSTEGPKITTSIAPSESTTSGTSSHVEQSIVTVVAFAVASLILRIKF